MNEDTEFDDLLDVSDGALSSSPQLVSLTELGRALVVSRPTVMNLIQQGMPYVTKADRAKGVAWEFDLEEVKEWIAERDFGKQAAKKMEQQEASEIIAARVAKLQVETDRLQLRLARERGEVVPIDSVAELVEGQLTTLRTHLLALPIKIAPVVAGHTDVEEIKQTITSYIREALQELCEDKIMEGLVPEVNEDVVMPPNEHSHLDEMLGIVNESDGQTATEEPIS